MQLFCQCYGPQSPVVEVGSRYAPGFQELCDLRPLFPGLEYLGCDIQPGPGVDRIEDAQALRFPSGSVGTMLLLEVLEPSHDEPAADRGEGLDGGGTLGDDLRPAIRGRLPEVGGE